MEVKFCAVCYIPNSFMDTTYDNPPIWFNFLDLLRTPIYCSVNRPKQHLCIGK